MSDRPRFSLCSLIFVAVLLAARASVAQVALTSNDFFVGVQATPGTTLTDSQVARFFNKARCDCDDPVYLDLTVLPSGLAKGSPGAAATISVWVGADCNLPQGSDDWNCSLLMAMPLSALFAGGRMILTADVRLLSADPNPPADLDAAPASQTLMPNATCTAPEASFTQTIWALVDLDGDGTPDLTAKDQILVDLTPPPAPDRNGVSVLPDDQGLAVGWADLDTTVTTDLLGYQILCDRAGVLQVFDDGTFAPGFQSCPATAAASGVEGLDPLFTCSPLLSPGTHADTVRVLQNGIVYGAAVVAIDQHGNPSAPDVFYGTPSKTLGFYDVYRNGATEPPGAATGGFCALAGWTTPGPTAPGSALALAALAMTMARRRRPPRRRG